MRLLFLGLLLGFARLVAADSPGEIVKFTAEELQHLACIAKTEDPITTDPVDSLVRDLIKDLGLLHDMDVKEIKARAKKLVELCKPAYEKRFSCKLADKIQKNPSGLKADIKGVLPFFESGNYQAKAGGIWEARDRYNRAYEEQKRQMIAEQTEQLIRDLKIKESDARNRAEGMLPALMEEESKKKIQFETKLYTALENLRELCVERESLSPKSIEIPDEGGTEI